jgi:hypothetical protein
MWGDDEPTEGEVPSPRTTIVGGRPPESGADLPPVPTGIQKLLRLAAVDRAFHRELLERRGELARAAGVEITESERRVLRAVPGAQLSAMIEGLPPPDEERRTFLRQTASTAVMLLGGAALAAMEGCTRGHRADVPPEVPAPPGPVQTAGARPGEPPPRPVHKASESEGGVSPHLRAPLPGAAETREERRMAAPGGAAPDVPRSKPDAGAPPRPQRRPRTKGCDAILPEDLADPFGSPTRPDAGPPRPQRPSPTRGIRPRVPPPRGQGDPGSDED